MSAVIDRVRLPARADRVFFTPWRLACLAIMVLSGLLYLPALGGLAVWDDFGLLYGGHQLGQFRAARNVLECFTVPLLGSPYYRPLPSLLFFCYRHLFHSLTFFAHQVNILVHVVTTGLLIGLLRSAFGSRRVALLGGLLFAVQPAQVANVAWIAGLTDTLCGLWMVGLAWVLILAAQAEGRRRQGFLIAAVVVYAFAIFTKESMLIWIVLAPLAFRYFAPERRIAWRSLVPFLVVGIVFVALWMRLNPPSGVTTYRGAATALILPGRTTTYYAWLLLLPTPGSLFTYTLGALEQAGVWTVLAGYSILALLGFCFLRCHKRHPAAAFFLALIVLTMFPMLNFLPLSSFPVAPYRADAVGIGIAALLGWALARSGSHRLGRTALATVLTTWFALLCVWGAHQWSDDLTFCTNVVRYCPDCIFMRHNLALDLLRANRPGEARIQIETMLAQLFGRSGWQSYATAHRALAADPHVLALVRENDLVLLPPDIWAATLYEQLGRARLQEGSAESARQAFEIGHEFDPRSATLDLGLAQCAEDRKDWVQAEQLVRTAIRLDPRAPSGHWMLADIMEHKGDWKAAIPELQTVIRLVSMSGPCYLKLAEVQTHLGDYEGARISLETAERCPLIDVSFVKLRLAALPKMGNGKSKCLVPSPDATKRADN